METKNFDRNTYKTQVEIPIAKGQEITYPFQWLLFKPQLHAVEPIELNQTSRNENTARSGDRTHADKTSRGSLG
jgi:hypothetical protein